MRLNRSSLVQLFSAPGRVDLAAPPRPQTHLAETLSQWLGWADAIELSTALSGPQPRPVKAPAPADVQACQREYAQASAAIRAAIHRDVQALHQQADDSARRSLCLTLQRTMETRLTPVRARVRAAVAGCSPDMARLAALDAALEQALAARERHLLATVPGLLAQQHNAQTAEATPLAANDALRSALLAELETRLQPIDGLLAALTQKMNA